MGGRLDDSPIIRRIIPTGGGLHGHIEIIIVCSGQMRKVGGKLHLKSDGRAIRGALIFTINLKCVQTFISVLWREVIVLRPST